MRYNSTENRLDYAPVFAGNGDIALALDEEGTLNYSDNDKINVKASAHVFRAGRRSLFNMRRKQNYNLLTYGSFKFYVNSKLKSFNRELVLPDGYQTSECNYESCSIRSRFFVHYNLPFYALEKTFDCDMSGLKYEFIYKENDYNLSIFDNVKVAKCKNGATVSFKICAQDEYEGKVKILLSKSCDVSVENGRIFFTFDAKKGESVTFFVGINDNFDDGNTKLPNLVKVGFQKLLDESIKLWNEYFNQGYIVSENKKLNDTYLVALYHLKTFTTKWSIPVGIYDKAWDGRFFAFDEYYGFLGLVGANRTDEAKRVPSFRLKNCFITAKNRAVPWFTPQSEIQARFMWETNEHGNEAAPYGFWNDHVFHMCVIGLGAYEYYEYTLDKEFLKDCFPMIKACAKFFSCNMVYTENGKPYVGKCTDLERLGASKERAFMTTCGAIKLFEVCAKAYNVLGVDDEYKLECEKLSEQLKYSLPTDDEKYLPYPNCKERSIGVFSCKFPFNVLENNDKKMINAFEDYIANESVYGNMYHGGSKVSPWYCAWKANAYARCKMSENTENALFQYFDSTGAFNESFEINEEGKRLRPWFMTASGVFMSAVNEMFVQCDGKTLELLPATTIKNVKFKLRVKGGIVVEAEIIEGEIRKLSLTLTSKDCVIPKVVYNNKEVVDYIIS